MLEASRMLLTTLGAMLLISFTQIPLLAQGLNAETTIDTIIGSEVHTEERAATSDQSEKVLKAISRASETAMEVRVVFTLEGVTIVFIPEANETGSAIAEAVRENRAAIRSLRQALQGNAMLFHSIDSQSVLLDNVLALEFGDDATATIYVAGKDPRN
jgi:hypothetical protein